MGVYKEIAKADGSGITTFYRLSEDKSTVETTSTGTTETMFDYNDTLNKPSINDVALVGNKTLEDLGIQPAGDYITEIPAEYITEEELEAKDYATEAYVIEQINNIEHFHREIVDALPLMGKDNVIYLVPKAGSKKDIYDEYIWTGTDYEFIGNTAIELDNFYQKEDVDRLLYTKVDKVKGKQLSTNDYTDEEKEKLANLELYTLPIASRETLGGIKIGNNLEILADGTLNATGGGSGEGGGLPSGGEKDQVLGKASNTDYDVKWMTVDMKDKENLFRYTEMPEANENNVGQVIQYIGETNEQFTQGKFYTNKAMTIKKLNKINYNGPDYLVDTPVKLGSNYKIEIKADLSASSTGNYSHYLISAANNRYYYSLMVSSNRYYYNNNGNGSYSTNMVYSPINEAIYVYNDTNHTITINGENIASMGSTPNNINDYLRIFYNNGENFNSSLYYCKIWNSNSELIYDAIPIKIDDKFALYDKINSYTTYINSNPYASEGDTIDTIIVYKWELTNKEPDILTTNLKWPATYSYITNEEWYDLFQYIVDRVNKGQTLPNILNNGFKLSEIRNDSSSSSSNNYRRWDFRFNNLYGTSCKHCYGYFYTNYDGNIVYGPSSSYKAYYNYLESTSFITSHQSLSNYLSKTNTTEYAPKDDYNPATKKYVDDSTKLLDNKFYRYPQEIYDKGFIYETDIIVPGKINYKVEDVSGADYNFVLNADEYYESTNQKIQSSYSLCKVTFNIDTETEIAINYINSGESSYDYGIFSQLDKTLSLSNSDDGSSGSTNVKMNCKGDSSLEVRTITYVVPEGEHFIYIKYRKDGSADSGNDSLQFKIIDESSHKKYTTEYMATKKYVDNASSRIYQDLYNAVNRLTFRRVSELPTTDISTTTIYLLGENDPYIMKAYIDENWITLGTTEINFEPTVFTNSEETYTINSLRGNQVYKLGEIIELNINSYVTFDRETLIYFQSGETATAIHTIEGLTHVGDCPKFTQPEGSTSLDGICEKKSKYIISILNDIALWKIIE